MTRGRRPVCISSCPNWAARTYRPLAVQATDFDGDQHPLEEYGIRSCHYSQGIGEQVAIHAPRHVRAAHTAGAVSSGARRDHG